MVLFGFFRFRLAHSMPLENSQKKARDTSWGKIVDHMKQLYPEAADTQIRKILK